MPSYSVLRTSGDFGSSVARTNGAALGASAAGAAGAAATGAPAAGAWLRKLLQKRHLIASSWISSAQNGHFFVRFRRLHPIAEADHEVDRRNRRDVGAQAGLRRAVREGERRERRDQIVRDHVVARYTDPHVHHRE